MANSLTAFNEAKWVRDMQPVFYKENVAIGLANLELRDYLEKGTTVHKPYMSDLIDQDYTKGTDISTFNDLSATDDSLTVDTCRIVPFYIDDLDKIQNKYDAATEAAQRAQRRLNNRLDQKVLSNYSSANAYISAQDLGGSGTGSTAITQANIYNLFAVGARKLEHANLTGLEKKAVIGPRLLEVLKLGIANRETSFGDSVGANGLVGSRFGFDVVVSNNIPFTAVLTYSGQPSNTETLKIDDVTFTFVTSIGSTAGNVLVETNEDTTYGYLDDAINETTTYVGTKWVALSAGDRKKLRDHGITCTISTGDNTLTITGYGDVPIVEAATNLVLTSNTQYPLFLAGKPIDLILQKNPNVEFRVAEKRLGRYVYAWTLYGSGVWTNMKDCFLYAKVDTSSWV